MNFDELSPAEFWSLCFAGEKAEEAPTLYSHASHPTQVPWFDVENSLLQYCVHNPHIDFRKRFPQVPTEFIFDKLFEMFAKGQEDDDLDIILFRVVERAVEFAIALKISERAIEAARLVLQADFIGAETGIQDELLQQLVEKFPEELSKDVLGELMSGVAL